LAPEELAEVGDGERDGLIKKGLVFSGERGTVAFTVPHFGKFLRSQR
jgi:hypothetical protein